VLGRLFENCPGDCGSSTATAKAIELCLSILSLELNPTKAILRRAAAISIFGMLKGIDSQLEAGNPTSSTPLMNGEQWLNVEKVLRWVVDTDTDELAVGHSKAVLEGLEAVRMKIIAGAVASASQSQSLDGKLKGLNLDHVPKNHKGERGKEIFNDGKLRIEEIE
jgi:hypothetical protein